MTTTPGGLSQALAGATTVERRATGPGTANPGTGPTSATSAETGATSSATARTRTHREFAFRNCSDSTGSSDEKYVPPLDDQLKVTRWLRCACKRRCALLKILPVQEL